jgi:hypothetical protein
MAADDAAVTVVLRADLKAYEAALKSAVRSTETAARAAEKAVFGIGKGGGASKVIEGNFRKSSQAIANDAKILQFQLNDIFSGLASGQGIRSVQVQLGQIAQQMTGASLAGGARLLGTALAGMINPLNLAIVAFGLLAGVAASYFSDSTEDAKKAADALKKQADELDDLAKKYGALFPELRRLRDEHKALADEAERNIAIQTALAGAYEKSAKTLAQQSLDISELLAVLEVMNKPTSELANAFNHLKEAINDHNASAKDAKPLLDALAAIIASSTGKAKELAATLRNQVVSSLNEVERAAKSAGETLQNSLQFQMPGAGGPLDMDPLIRARERAQHAGELAGTAYLDGLRQAFTGGQSDIEGFQRNFGQRLNVFIKAAAEQAGQITIFSAHRTIERQAELFAEAVRQHGSVAAARKFVAAPTENAPHVRGIAADLRFESDAVRQWAHDNAEAYGLVFRMSHEGWHIELADQEKVRESRKASVASTKELSGAQAEAAQLAEEAHKKELAAAEVRIKLADEQKQAARELEQQMANIFGGALQSFTHDLINGADAGEAFNSMLRNLTSQIADLAIQMLIIKPLMNSLFGGFGGMGGGATGGLFEAGGTVGLSGQRDGRNFSPLTWAGAPRFAAGGMVGLRPGEVPIIAHRGEIIIPNARRIAGAGAAAGGGRQTVDVRVSAAPSPLLDLSIKTSAKQAEERAVSRGPAVARANNQRYATP